MFRPVRQTAAPVRRQIIFLIELAMWQYRERSLPSPTAILFLWCRLGLGAHGGGSSLNSLNRRSYVSVYMYMTQFRFDLAILIGFLGLHLTETVWVTFVIRYFNIKFKFSVSFHFYRATHTQRIYNSKVSFFLLLLLLLFFLFLPPCILVNKDVYICIAQYMLYGLMPVGHTSVLYEDGWMDRASFQQRGYPGVLYPCFNGIRVSPKIIVLPAGIFFFITTSRRPTQVLSICFDRREFITRSSTFVYNTFAVKQSVAWFVCDSRGSWNYADKRQTDGRTDERKN